MSSYAPSAIKLNGVEYPLLDRADLEESLPYSWRPYHERVESVVVQQAEISGSSRPGKSSRPDELTWRIDDWSAGENLKFLDASDDESFRRYWYSDLGAVDVRTKGQLTLGYLVTDDTAGIGNITVENGPFLSVANGFLTAIATDVGTAQRNRRKNLSTGAWAAMTSTLANTAGVVGQTNALGNFVYAGYRGTGGVIRRYDPSANTELTHTSSVSESPKPLNGLVFYALDSSTGNGGKMDLRSSVIVPTVFPSSPTTSRYLIDGVGKQCGLDGVGKRIYIVTQGNDEEPHIHQYDGTSGTERAILPQGFRMDTSPFGAVICLSDLIFCAGYREGDTNNPEVPMLVYVSGGRVGTVGTVREGVLTGNRRFTCLAPGFRNQLVLGSDFEGGFVYDIQNAGLSQLFSGFASTDHVRSVTFAKGKYYFGTRTTGAGSQAGKVYATQLSGSNRYPAQGRIVGSVWDMGYPEASKLITDITLQTAPLPVGTKVTLRLVLDDDTTTITTDKDGNTLEFTTVNAKTKVFQISGVTAAGASVSRFCKSLRVDIQLDSDSTKASTPTVYAVTVRALPYQFVHFFEATIRLQDDSEGQAVLGIPGTTGYQKAQLLRTLRNQQPAIPVLLQPRYVSGDDYEMPDVDATTYTVVLTECETILTRRGNGYARVVLRRIDGP